MSRKNDIIKLLKDEEAYSAQEIAEFLDVSVVYVRSVASRNGFTIPTLLDRVKDLLKQRKKLLKELGK